MKASDFNRRKFIKSASTNAAGLMILSVLSKDTQAAAKRIYTRAKEEPAVYEGTSRIKFSVIGINHDHIYGMIGAVIRGGGELVSYYVREPELASAFAKRYPQAKQARTENEVLEDKNIQLILSSIIPDERAPLGVKVMQHGKDYMVDKPGITTLEQLAEVRRVQKTTKRIYSIMYSERL